MKIAKNFSAETPIFVLVSASNLKQAAFYTDCRETAEKILPTVYSQFNNKIDNTWIIDART